MSEPEGPAAARRSLAGLLRGLEDTVATLEAGDGAPLGEAEAEQHATHDVASDLTDQASHEALLARARAQRDEVLAALARLDDGTYGRCVDCGAAIPAERLLARPEAARCLADQTRVEQAG